MALSGILSSSQITSLIQQATAAAQIPAGVLQAQEKPIQAQVSALTKVQGTLSALQSALTSLSNVQSLAQRSVSVSPTGAVTATADNTTATGTHSLTGIRLAASESLISSGSASASSTFGAGTLTIQVGAGTAVNVSVTSGQSSLAGIAAAIDQANAGVQASVVFDGSKYHLVLTGNSTGAANAFTVRGSGALVGFSYASGASGLSRTRQAADASFSFDGLTITSGSNTIGGVVPGLSLTLAQSGSATVTVSQDATALDGAAQSLATAVNQVLSTINQNASFNPTSGAGPLFGNVGLEIIRTDLLNVLTGPPNGVTAPGSPYSSLSSVGFSIASGGTIKFDQSAFAKAATTNYGAVAALLGEVGRASNPNVAVAGIGAALVGTYAVSVTSNSGGTVVGTINGQAANGTGGLLVVSGPGAVQGLSLQIAPGITGALGTVTISQGVFSSLSSIVTSALASGSGSITGQITHLNTSITSMNKQVKALLARAKQESQILTAQFTAAQATLSQLSTVSNFLTTFFNQTPATGI